METTFLVQSCGIAFMAVFCILTFLAVAMKLMTTVFPAKQTVIDSTMVAAITSSVTTVFPGASVTRIEDES